MAIEILYIGRTLIATDAEAERYVSRLRSLNIYAEPNNHHL